MDEILGVAVVIRPRRTVGPVFFATSRVDRLMYLLGPASTVVANIFGRYHREGVSI